MARAGDPYRFRLISPNPASNLRTAASIVRTAATKKDEIAWQPSEPSKAPPGHLWRWELEPLDDSRTLVTHTYDWSALTDENRLPRARATTADKLLASIERLAELAERG